MNRRTFLGAAGALALSFRLKAETTEDSPCSFCLQAEPGIRIGYAAITWGGDDVKAIEEIGDVGFKGIQLRASVLDRFAERPGDLKTMLAKRGLTFAVLSSGNLKYQPADVASQLDIHLDHARFVRDAGGLMLQVIDEKPKDRAPGADDYKRLADLMNTLGAKTKAIGVPLVYHHHMNSTGEPPAAIDAIVGATDPVSVGLLFDIAHYQQGGGNPAPAIRRFGKRITVVHLKDVRPIEAAPGHQWVELGRGRVDVKGCVAALKEIGFDGWAIVELDRVVDPGGTPKACAEVNRDYVVKQLGLSV